MKLNFHVIQFTNHMLLLNMEYLVEILNIFQILSTIFVSDGPPGVYVHCVIAFVNKNISLITEILSMMGLGRFCYS